MPRLSVWVVTPEIHRQGGTEYSIAEQVERWRSQFDLRLYTMRTDRADLKGVTLRKIPMPPGPHLSRYLWWFATSRALRWWDAGRLGIPDVVYSPGINAPESMAMSVHIVFAKFWERVRGRVISDLLRPGSTPRALHRILYWRLLQALERRTYSGPATLWAISTEDARELEARFGRPRGTVPVVPHGVDARWFSPAARAAARPAARKRLGVGGARVVLAVGNDAHKKGFDVALESLAFLPQDVVLALAGSSDPRLLGAWAREAGVVDRVHLWPHKSDVLDYYAAADVLVAPSREDAFHLPALEALACGLPVVVSGKAGVSGLLEDRRHALILKNPEDPEKLAQLVSEVFSDLDLTERLGCEGRALAERCSWQESADRSAELIELEATTPRFLVLATDLNLLGGIQRATRTLVLALAELYGAERVGLVSFDEMRELPSRSLHSTRSGAPDRALLGKVSYALAAIRAARRWRRRLVIVACHPHLAVLAWACSRVSGAPFAVWCHGKESWGRIRWGIRFALRRADRVFAGSAFTARQVEHAAGLVSGRVQVVPHCVTPELKSEEDLSRVNGHPTVVAVARLNPSDAYKGLDTLVYAFPKVVSRIPDARLVVVGEGADRARLERLAHLLGLNERVHFTGRLSDTELGRVYGEASVFALPGHTQIHPRPEGEGFGLVFLEAGAWGLPALAGNGGGAAEAVVDGKTGLLVDPDDPESVVRTLCRLLEDPGLARRMGEAARARVAREFSYEQFRERIRALIAELFQKHHT
jgi:phosphatidylinositol alpha-1,6-mannosyltransferase